MLNSLLFALSFVLIAYLFFIIHHLNEEIEITTKQNFENTQKLDSIDIPESVRQYLLTDPGMVMTYLIISLRGEFMYNLARQTSEDPVNIKVYYQHERSEIDLRLQKIYPEMTKENRDLILNEYYK